MNNPMKPLIFPLVLVAGLAISTLSANAQSATATISDVADGSGNYDYTITLYNTDPSYAINGFWYGWTYNGNNLYSSPSSADNSLGWSDTVNFDYYYYSIEWDNSYGYGSALEPGQSATFTFTSPDSPDVITADPSGESVAYVYGIDGTQSYPGDSTDVFSPTLITVPEPSTWALLTIGAAGLATFFRYSANRSGRSPRI